MIHVTEYNSTIIGFISALIIDSSNVSFLVPMLKCRIGTIVVTKSWRKKGVGRSLVASIEKAALECGAKDLSLEVMGFNKGASKFYEAMGFGVFSTNLTRPLT